MPRILLETIVSSLDDARAAAAGGADRFELCSALAVGGLTPSLGLLASIKASMDVPVMFMLRPREGGMAYSDDECAVMERDLELALEYGADGFVFGFLTRESAVDVARCRQLLRRMDGAGRLLQTVFHRAFDVVADPYTALEQLIDLGITRVLTSGRAAQATDGLDEIRRNMEQAVGRIQILPGGGIRLDTVEQVVRETGVDQVHLSITKPAPDPSAASNPQIRFGVDAPASETEYRAVTAAGVRRVREALDGMGA